jgi:hypothetical protein
VSPERSEGEEIPGSSRGRARRGRRPAIAIAIIALGLVLAWHLRPAPPPPSAVAFPIGREQVYALSWKTSTESRAMSATDTPSDAPAPTPLRSAVDLEGDLVLSSFGKEGDHYLVTARFEKLTRAEVHALGQSLLPSLVTAREQLENRSVELELKPNGELSSVRFQPKDPALFRYLMQAAVNELAVELHDAKTTEWTAELEGPSGRGPVRFTRDGDRPLVVRRTRERYDALGAWPIGEPPPQKLASTGQLTLAPNGTIEELTERETLEAARSTTAKDVASTTSFAITKRAERPFDASQRPSGYEAMPALDAGVEDETARRERLERRAEGVTLERVIDDLHIHAAVPKGKSTQWAWIAQAYFELHPEKTGELVERMRGFDINTKALTIDLLVMVGHERAQAAACDAFRSGAVAGGAEYALLVQRLGQLNHPTKATADYVLDRYTKAKAEDDIPARRASAIALGGLIAGTAKTDRLAARALDDALVLDLYAAKDPKDRELLLLALGNAALEEDALAIRLSSHDALPPVRAAVATALRRFDSEEVRRTLVELFADPDIRVQHDALMSLDRRELSSQELSEILSTVEKDRVHHANIQSLVNLCAHHRGAAEVTAILDALAKREDLDAATRGRILRVRDGA